MHSDRVLVVEDDEAVRDAIRSGLTVHGFDVTVAADGETAVQAVIDKLYDVVVLDVGLPGISGIEVCQYLRRQEIDVPILILSARDEVGDRVAGLQAGADDYLVKPFDLSELVARVAALLRRSVLRPTTTAVLRLGDLRIDADRRSAFVGDELLDLTRREFDLLLALATNPGVVLSRLAVARTRVGVRLRRRHQRRRCLHRLSPSETRRSRPATASSQRCAGVGFVLEVPMKLATRTGLAALGASALAIVVLSNVVATQFERVLRERVDERLTERAELSAPILVAVGDRISVSELNGVIESARVVTGVGTDEMRTVVVGPQPDGDLPAVAAAGLRTVEVGDESWRLLTVEVDDVPTVGDQAVVEFAEPLGAVQDRVREIRRTNLLRRAARCARRRVRGMAVRSPGGPSADPTPARRRRDRFLGPACARGCRTLRNARGRRRGARH